MAAQTASHHPQEASVQASATGRPNILFILCDDHAAHAISAYGSALTQTPHIDRLARDGMRFKNCFCINSLCAPSRATVLTGQYGHRNGVLDNRQRFDGSRTTFPKLLQLAGYQTALFGKWHLQSQPTGFHHYKILPGQGRYFNPLLIEDGVEVQRSGYVTDLLTDQALAWMKNRNPSQPFCLMLHHKAPHADWEVEERYARYYEDREIPEPETLFDEHHTRAPQIRQHRLTVGENLWNLHYRKRFGDLPPQPGETATRRWVYQRFVKDYLRCSAAVDDSVGRILDFLDAQHLTESTAVIYTSDHGFFLGDHGLYDKRFMYEHALRIPLLMRYPREIPAGGVQQAMALNLDYASTILDLAGLPLPADLQGRSLRSLWKGPPPADWRNSMYYRFYEEDFGIGPMEGIRTSRHKLIHYLYGGRDWELFDLKKDPNEMNNLYHRPESAALIETLKTEMESLKSGYGLPPDHQTETSRA